MVGTTYLLIGEFSFWHIQDTDICISRMGKFSTVTHSVVRNSCTLISDAEPAVVDSESDGEESSHSGSKAGSPNCQFKESSKTLKLNAGSQKVSESGAKCFKGESRNSLLVMDRLIGRQLRKLNGKFNVSLTWQSGYK